MHAIVEELVRLVGTHGWRGRFDEAVRMAAACDVPAIAHIRTFEDFLADIDALVTWAPVERPSADLAVTTDLYRHFLPFYFVLDRPPLRELQSPVAPGAGPASLTPLSEWIVAYAGQWGRYLDTTESAKHVKSFRDDPKFNWDDYMPPPSSHAGEEDWRAYRTFNQFFARHVKPGMRPIAGLADHGVIVSPADSAPVGVWPISAKSDIFVADGRDGLVASKGLVWSIHALLADSAFADRFAGGLFTHASLTTFDYHRFHTPVQGRVVEARIVRGQAWLDVTVGEALVDGRPTRILKAENGTGYQFVQTRGLVMIESPIGLVACIPMGMGQVSSVVLTAGVGVTLHKGEELGYFQFGGSDFVMAFERASNVQLVVPPGVRVKQGAWIGSAFPYR